MLATTQIPAPVTEPAVAAPVRPSPPALGPSPPPSGELGEILNRLEREERIEADRREQERLTKLRDMARFD